MISIICPIFNEEKYIEKCINSILDQDYPKDDIEVFFVDGISEDNTRIIIKNYTAKFPFIYLLDNPQKIVPYAMNKGIIASSGEIIIRLDAHATYEKNYISTLVRRLRELNADNVGAVCRTDVLNKNSKTLSIREVLGNRFGVGNSVFRTGVDKIMEVDTVPFGCWRREVFDKYGLYDVRLVRNQDIELNKRIIRDGGKIYIVPDTYCTYLARETFKALSKNNYQNGKWNILTVYYTKQFDSLSLRHFIPMMFVLSLCIPIFCSLFFPFFIYISLFSILFYMLMLFYVSLCLTIRKHLNLFYLLSSFIVLHVSYGWGSFIGVLNLPFMRNKT